MGKQAMIGVSLIIWCLFFVTPNNVCATKQSAAADDDTLLRLHDIRRGKEKLAKLEIYVHDFRVGSANPTVFEVATASITSNSPTSFGSVHVVDDLVTAGPDVNSTAIGRIQGLTTSADLTVNAVALNLNVIFSAGRVNGSSISLIGRNPVANAERELVVAGGTGVFRFAQGYAIQTTTYYSVETFYGVFKYTIYTTYDSKLMETADVVEISEI